MAAPRASAIKKTEMTEKQKSSLRGVYRVKSLQEKNNKKRT